MMSLNYLWVRINILLSLRQLRQTKHKREGETEGRWEVSDLWQYPCDSYRDVLSTRRLAGEQGWQQPYFWVTAVPGHPCNSPTHPQHTHTPPNALLRNINIPWQRVPLFWDLEMRFWKPFTGSCERPYLGPIRKSFWERWSSRILLPFPFAIAQGISLSP